MQKIAVIGAHGVGKTKLCNSLWSYCWEHNKEAALVEEVVRRCPFPIHDKQNADTTLWIISRQITLELEAAKSNPDYIICDRSILDPLVYLLSANPDDVNPEIVTFAEAYSRTYDSLYLVKPSKRPIDEDGYRDTNVEFQYAIHAIFTNWMVGRCHIIDAEDIFNDVDNKLCKKIIGDLT